MFELRLALQLLDDVLLAERLGGDHIRARKLHEMRNRVLYFLDLFVRVLQLAAVQEI